ncbi:MAG TPA: PDZ domain-containing protein [Verrucomicrobiae bacterium]
MKIQSFIRFEILACVLVLAGCASQPKEKAIQQRGWIGGSYKRAAAHLSVPNRIFSGDDSMYCFPSKIPSSQKAGILTTAVATNTPAFDAGLRAGDLILEADGEPMTELHDFLNIVTATQPGGALTVKAYRKGKTMDFNMTTGREKYREAGNLTIGLPGFFGPLRLVPTSNVREFSLVAVGYKRNDNSPFEFGDVKEQYRRDCHPKDKPQGYDEDWKFWLAIMQITKGKTILAQEPFASAIKD